MKKEIIIRCLIGAPIGLSISYLITVAFSLGVGDGNFYPVVPELIQMCGSEINAVLLQSIFSLLYGIVCGGASVIWNIESWGLLRMTFTHLALCSAAIFPIAYFMYWMPHNALGIFLYFSIFFVIYLFIWIWQYCSMRKKITQINRKVQENNSSPA